VGQPLGFVCFCPNPQSFYACPAHRFPPDPWVLSILWRPLI
jgi:hypothetical protein